MLVKKVTKIEIMEYRTSELAVLYRMSNKTFLRNIKGIKDKLGKKIGQKWSIEQVQIMLHHCVPPYTLEMEEIVEI